MDDTASPERMAHEQDRRLTEVVERERPRLAGFIRRRVRDPGEAEDVLQEVWAELVEANRLLVPIEHVTGWLYRVARNRIIDLFRRRRPELFGDLDDGDDDGPGLEELLPSPGDGPEAVHLRGVLIDELAAALAALPEEQRDAFVGHELEGRSFKEMAAATGVSVNTLLARKRYAVLKLRERLQDTYAAFRRG